MVHPIGFEPTTPGSEDQCSNPLSYGCIVLLYHNLLSLARRGLPKEEEYLIGSNDFVEKTGLIGYNN